MNYHLLIQLTRRDIISRNKGSALGNAWSILTSVGTLAMYTFIFTQVFAAKWPRGNQENSFVYALQIYAGLILFNFVSDMLSRAPTLVTDHANLIQKVVFPSEILPLVSLGSALYFFAINTAILNVASMLVLGEWHVWSLLGPLTIFPLALTTLGLTYFVSALAVFIRDVRQVVGLHCRC